MINDKMFKKLNQVLQRSWLINSKFNSASAAVTESSSYFSGYFESKTHLLDISSEQGAIVLAVSNKDPEVKKIITLVRGEFELNPLVIKFFIDHSRRTGASFSYKVINRNGKTLFFSKDVCRLLPFYHPKTEILGKIKNWKPRENKIPYDSSSSIYKQLKRAAKKGMETHFTKTSQGSLYGCSVLAGGKIYFGGVYSCLDNRLSLHSEIVALLSAIMDGERRISWLGLISNKFIERVPQLCGCCRQFLMEIQQKTKTSIKIVCFSYNRKNKFEINLNDYLPYMWNIDNITKDSL